MKYLLKALVVATSAFAITHPALGNEVQGSPSDTSYTQAALLSIEPATITSNKGNVIYQTDRLNQIAQSIPAAQALTPQPIKPLDLFKAPAATIERLSQQEYEPTPKPIDPIGSFRVEPLDSGVSVTVSHF